MPLRALTLLLVFLATVTASADVFRIAVIPPGAIHEDHTAVWHVVIENISGFDQPSYPLYLFKPPGTLTATPPDLGCMEPGICSLPPLARGAALSFDVGVKYPFRHASISLTVRIVLSPNAAEEESAHKTFWLDFPVTTTDDAGPGSFRQAILDLNASSDCEYNPPATPPCRVIFRLPAPVPAEGWYTIRPLTPLPALDAYHPYIDAMSQPGASERGPVVALDGSALLTGNGIDIASTTSIAAIRGLAIGGFPWNGIHVANDYAVIDRCFIGVDPSGERAHPNGARGIVIERSNAVITNNVISGNARSGIFVAGGDFPGPQILNNRIGVAAHSDAPLGNGASGIFVGDFGHVYGRQEITNNVIANNAHFGVALSLKAAMPVLANTIRDNGLGGIDIRLDGPTDAIDGVPGFGGVLPPPVITSARYENGVTIITGYSLAGNASREVLLYANASLDARGFAEGEQYLGITPLMLYEDKTFRFVFEGDLRGKYVNGISYGYVRWGWDEAVRTTSELGRAVLVE